MKHSKIVMDIETKKGEKREKQMKQRKIMMNIQIQKWGKKRKTNDAKEDNDGNRKTKKGEREENK